MMAESAERLEAGDLDGAIEALNGDVRRSPSDTSRRAELAELLCFAGDLERADRLLDVVEHQDAGLAVGVALFRQLLRAEQARQQFYREGRLPEFLAPPDALEQLYLRAGVAQREGDAAGAAALLGEAEDHRAPLAGVADGVGFADFRDLDDLSATHLDVLTSTGKFYWIPLRRIESITLHAPRRRRDLLWRPAALAIAAGPDGEVFLPTIYPSDDAAQRAAMRLGRATDFVGGAGAPTRGIGLRSFLVGDEARTILELARLDFAAAA